MKSKKMMLGLLLLIVIVVIGIFYFTNNKSFVFRQNYSEIYTLVQDKVSKSAPIVINLPKGVQVLGSEQAVKFIPEIKGEWVKTPLINAIAFKPRNSLELGKYYTVVFNGATGAIKKDFMADEDPRVIDIFPQKDSEADESSSITISFSRPMVPLTTLDVLDGNPIPIEITPATKGKFKWISTRTLQFIPETHLVRSAHYSVKVLAGLTSMDGLSVAGFSHNFTTRPLNFQGVTSGTILYNQPIEIRFNQPVDLERTVANLSLTTTVGGKRIDFNAVYGIIQSLSPKKRTSRRPA